MDKHALKEYVQNIQNKISLAIAIAVLRSKPKNISAREYASSLQEKVLHNWIKKHEVSVFEDKILELQQRRIFGQITDLLPPTQAQLGSPDKTDVQLDIPDICTDLVWPEEAPACDTDSDNDNDSSIRKNINFIQAMVQLKFAVETSKRIPVDQVHSFIQGKFVKQDEAKVSLTEDFCIPKCSEDSGYGDSSSFIVKDANTVSTSALRFVTHSYKTEALIHKCISSLLSHVRNFILNDPEESFKFWKGSLLEHLVSVFKGVSDNYICSQVVLKLILDIVEEIWISDDLGKNLIWEYQMTMLSEFCYNSFISETTIDFIMKKIDVLNTKISTGNIYDADNWNNLHLLEKAPLFLSMLSLILEKWRALRKPVPVDIKEDTLPFSSVTEHWKNTCGKESKRADPECDRLGIVRNWKTICEKCVTCSSQLFPLISYQVWWIIEILDSCLCT